MRSTQLHYSPQIQKGVPDSSKNYQVLTGTTRKRHDFYAHNNGYKYQPQCKENNSVIVVVAVVVKRHTGKRRDRGRGREPVRGLRKRVVGVNGREDIEEGNNDANDDNSVDSEEQRLRMSHFLTPISPCHLL